MIENLRLVQQLEDQPPSAISKTLFFPRSLVPSVAWLGEQEESPQQVLDLHYRRDLEALPCTSERVRAELVEETYSTLLDSHPLYRDLNKATVMASIKEDLEYMVNMGLVVEEDPAPSQKVYSILMPDQCPLSPHQSQILAVRALDTKLAAIYDPRGEAGVEQDGREVTISLQQWSEQRLNNVQRQGPMNQPGVVLALALQHCTQRLYTARPGQRLDNRPGTSSYYHGLRDKLVTLCQWRGPPTFSVSVSFNPSTELMLSTWVSHTGGVEGRQEKIWHVGSEEQELSLRPGKERESQPSSGSFYVHCKSEEEDDNCPYHSFCRRQSVEEWRER